MAFENYQRCLWTALATISVIVLRSAANSNQTPEQFISMYSHHQLSSDFMLSLYQNLTNGIPLNQAIGRPKHWRDVKFADTVRSFPVTSVYEWKQQQYMVYKFNLSQIGSEEQLRAAEFRVRLPELWTGHDHLYALAIASKDNALVYASAVPIATTHFSANGMLIMDITSSVQDWLEYVNSRSLIDRVTLDLAFAVLGRRKAVSRTRFLKRLEQFYVSEKNDAVLENGRTPLDAILVVYTNGAGDFFAKENYDPLTSDGHPSALHPQMNVEDDQRLFSHAEMDEPHGPHETNEDRFIFSANKGFSRRKRQSRQDIGGVCRRKDLEIDFPALGWGEWVVYPTQFNAYQCTGRCGGFTDSRNNPTNHAIVRSLVRLVSRNAIPVSCCTPTRLSPLSILYLEKGSVVIKHHEDMIVEECGCM